MKPTMPYDDYLRLTGLLTLAADHRKILEAIERSACAITGQQVEDGGHTSDAIWTPGYSTDRLLRLLGREVPTPTTTPEDVERQAVQALRFIDRAKELFPEE